MKKELEEGERTFHLTILRNNINKLLNETNWKSIDKLSQVKGIELKGQLVRTKAMCNKLLQDSKPCQNTTNEHVNTAKIGDC